jgi:hypothetical protein
MPAGTAAGERAILRRRNAEPEQRSRVVKHPSHQPAPEQRRQRAGVDLALLLSGARLQHLARVGAEGASEQMDGSDEPAEQAEAV